MSKNSLAIKGNPNYTAEVVVIPEPTPIPNADRLEGFHLFGYTIIGAKGSFTPGEKAIFFPAEVQLSSHTARELNLHRHTNLNADPKAEAGYLEDNRRVRALRLRGTVSSGFMVPIEKFAAAFGQSADNFEPGASFDHIGDTEVCRKYVIKEPVSNDPTAAKVKKAFKRVDERLFPEHIDTDQYLRNEGMVAPSDTVIVTQKLHGTSARFGNVPVHRKLGWLERLAKRLGVKVDEWEYDTLAGSRKVIKDIGSTTQRSYYGADLWNEYLEGIESKIPANFLVYGEIVGWTGNRPIQKGHTYDEREGECTLYVYRVAVITEQGAMVDLSWDQVRRFCKERGLEHVKELWRGPKSELNLEDFHEKNFFQEGYSGKADYRDIPVPLSPGGTGADEGIALRVETQGGLTPLLFKQKNPSHFEFETKILDEGEVDIESKESQ